jgi:Mor family transcriptional regulator
MSRPSAAPPQPLPPPTMPWDEAGDDDIVADILRRVLALAPEFSAALMQPLVQVDREVRETWGGERLWIARRAGQGRSERNEAIRRDHRAGEHTGLLCRRYQLSRQRIHQILREPPEAV